MGALGANGLYGDLLFHGHPHVRMWHRHLHRGAGVAADGEGLWAVGLVAVQAPLAMVVGIAVHADRLLQDGRILCLSVAIQLHRDLAGQPILAHCGPHGRSSQASTVHPLGLLRHTLLQLGAPEAPHNAHAFVQRLHFHAGLVKQLHMRLAQAICRAAEGLDGPDVFQLRWPRNQHRRDRAWIEATETQETQDECIPGSLH
mmetsp:Transcript_61346/g.97192  ORF Transcript_61346/g.97192 Transcript_61346/m.97192 type:complete len:201 (-) Transcript_61346:58-660(-)